MGWIDHGHALTAAERHRCPTPGFWARRRDHIEFDALWQCECGKLWVWLGNVGWSQSSVPTNYAISGRGPEFSPWAIEESKRLRAAGYKGNLPALDYYKDA